MRSKVIILVLFFTAFSLRTSFAQEQQDTLVQHYYAKALANIDKKDFTAADADFKKILSLKGTVPDELAYFYGYTLVNLNKYTLGKQLLKKYMDLRGDTARYYHYASDIINLADCKERGYYFVQEICDECHGEGKALIRCRTCNGRGNELCSLCGGSGVLKKKDNFGETFNTCTKCGGKGDYVCTVCHGTKLEKTKCFVCDGKGTVRIKKECDVMLMGQGKQ